MVDHIPGETVPVVPHSRREARASQRSTLRSRLAGIGGVGVALGVTAAVVLAPVASAGTAPAKVAVGSAVKTHNVSAVTAPAVEVDVSVSVPTIVKNEPPPAPKAKVKAKSSPKKSKSASQVAADADKDCGDKAHGDKDSWKNKH